MTRPAIVWHGHESCRFDADPDVVAAYLADLILRHGLALFTTTECRSRKLTRALRRLLPDEYGVVRRFEYLIVWHRPTYRGHWLAALAALDPRSFPMLGGRRMFRIARKRLVHRDTGTRLRVEVTHAPSGVVAGPGRFSGDTDRVRIWRSGMARLSRRLNRYRRAHPDGCAVVHMDSNVDVFRVAWRTYLNSVLGPVVWSLAGLPHEGTHGRRLIDLAVLVNLDSDRAAVVDTARPPKLDHAPFVYRAIYPTTGGAPQS